MRPLIYNISKCETWAPNLALLFAWRGPGGFQEAFKRGPNCDHAPKELAMTKTMAQEGSRGPKKTKRVPKKSKRAQKGATRCHVEVKMVATRYREARSIIIAQSRRKRDAREA